MSELTRTATASLGMADDAPLQAAAIRANTAMTRTERLGTTRDVSAVSSQLLSAFPRGLGHRRTSRRRTPVRGPSAAPLGSSPRGQRSACRSEGVTVERLAVSFDRLDRVEKLPDLVEQFADRVDQDVEED